LREQLAGAGRPVDERGGAVLCGAVESDRIC
jgi:hypothetical protein